MEPDKEKKPLRGRDFRRKLYGTRTGVVPRSEIGEARLVSGKMEGAYE